MYNVLYRRLLQVQRPSQGANLGFDLLQNVRFLSSIQAEEVGKQEKRQSFVVSYLVNSCGLSLESAKAVAKKVNLKYNKKGADAILVLLRSHGFTDALISKIVKSRPRLLLLSAEKTLSPKLQFYDSLGFKNDELARFLCRNPAILEASLKDTVIPVYNYIKGLGFSDDEFASALKGNSWFVQSDLQKKLIPNIALLQDLGVPKSSFPNIFKFYGSAILRDHETFSRNAKRAIELGFNPQTVIFIHALHVFASVNERGWEKKVDALRKWGWSDEQLQRALRRFPLFMAASEEKMNMAMEFLLNQMGWNTEDITKYPHVLLYNFERTVLPRCFVIKVLQLKGKMQRTPAFSTLFKYPEKRFLERFVTKYLESVPELLNVYHRKVDPKDSS